MTNQDKPWLNNPVATFWRRWVLLGYAQQAGEDHNDKVRGGSLTMTPERIAEAEASLVVKERDDGSVYCGGVIYASKHHPCITNYGEPKLTQDEIEWMNVVMYGYGLPWGG